MDTTAHSTQAAHGHMHDYEGHVEAVEADLEYWRTKRLEPRLIQLHRRGVLTLYDLLRAAAHVPAAPVQAGEAAHEIEGRIRALEDGPPARIPRGARRLERRPHRRPRLGRSGLQAGPARARARGGARAQYSARQARQARSR